MLDLAQGFRSGGIWMYMVLAESLFVMAMLAGCSIGFLVSFFRSEKRRRWRLISGGLLLATVLLVLGTGGLGWYDGMQQMQDAVRTATPDLVEKFRDRGTKLALIPLKFAALVAALPFAAGLTFLLTGLFSNDPAPAKADH